MPPRGPLSLSETEGKRLLALLTENRQRDLTDRRWDSVFLHLTLALANHTKNLQAQPQDNNSDASFVVIVIKDDEADGIMDMLERGDSIYNLTQACLLKMRVG